MSIQNKDFIHRYVYL